LTKKNLVLPRCSISSAVKNKVVKVVTDYQYGHIIGSMLGGNCDDQKNVLPKNAKLNQDFYECVENFILACLKAKPDDRWFITMRVSLFYQVKYPSLPDRKVPDAIVVQCKTFETKDKLKYQHAEFFPNTASGLEIEQKVSDCLVKKFIKPWNFAPNQLFGRN
jgi:DNA/RNA non-specific endonuclease